MLRTVLFSIILLYSAASLPAQVQDQTASKELTQYIRDAKKAGLKDDQIQQNAVKSGWPEGLVKEAMESVRAMPMATSPDAGPVRSAGAEATPGAPATRIEVRTVGSAAPEPASIVKPPVNRGVSDEYQIGEGDVLQVSVWGEAAASVPSVVVRPDGMISMPLIKDVKVAGMTPAEAEKVITELLSKQIRAADVTVIVSGIHSKKVFFVGGGVKKEGPIPYTYKMTIMQGLSEAGGLTDYAKRKKIYVLRNENGRQYKLAFDYDAVLRGEHMELNLPLLPGDTIVVPNH
jgi:polysaccharide export outer membrane protein